MLDGLIQRRQRPDPSTYIGRGKVSDLRAVVLATGADTVICDGELSPSQLRNLENEVKVKVIDRVALILDIFAQHAKSKEGKAQVELAQLQYLLPRLRGWGEAMSRQAGGSAGGNGGVGLRGPGETKLETDRRRIRTRISRLRREIAGMATIRETKRAGRRRNPCRAWPSPATPTPASPACSTGSPAPACWSRTRCSPRWTRPPGRPARAEGRVYTLSDTVGFVRHLPHQLVEAFRSTLEEVGQADLVVHVVDGAHPDPEEQVRAVREVLADVDADAVPELLVVNKTDAADEETLLRLKRLWPEAVFVSARTGAGIAELRAVRSSSGCRAGGRGAGAACRTRVATCSRGCTRAARCWRPSTPATGTLRPRPGRRGAGRGAGPVSRSSRRPRRVMCPPGYPPDCRAALQYLTDAAFADWWLASGVRAWHRRR